MPKCFVDLSHPLYGYNKQDKNSNIIVSVTEEIRPCIRWKTKNFLKVSKGTFVNYDRKEVPVDQVNCNPIECFNTGTLFIDTSQSNKTAKVSYQLRSSSDNYSLGFNFIYLNLPQKGDYALRVTVSDFMDTEQKNAYVYTYNFHANVPGEYLRTIDFLDTRVMTQIGNGWNISDLGVVISYELTYVDTAPLEVTQFGFSTGFIINERAELRKFANVILSCLTSFTHNVSTPTTDARCFGRQYDADQIEITKEITATTHSCNDYWLNPLQSVSQQLTSGIPVTDEFLVERVEYDGKEYGTFYIPDIYYNDCNSLTISSDKCECTYLTNLPVSQGTNLEDDEFILLSKEGMADTGVYGNGEELYTNILERGTVLVNPIYIGSRLLVTYNAEREVELVVANDKRLNRTKFRVIQEVENTRGIKEYFVFNNVLITENSREYGTEGEVTLSLSFTVSRDERGNFYEIRRNSEDLGFGQR